MGALGLNDTHGILRRPGIEILAESEGLRWSSAFAAIQRELPYDESFPAVDSHLVILHLDGHVKVDRWLDGTHDARHRGRRDLRHAGWHGLPRPARRPAVDRARLPARSYPDRGRARPAVRRSRPDRPEPAPRRPRSPARTKARVSPDAAFSLLDWTANVIFIVVIGGIGTIEGPIVGVLVFALMQTYLSGFGAWYLIMLGALAIAVMLLCPRGLWGTLANRYDIALFPIRRRLAIDATDRRS